MKNNSQILEIISRHHDEADFSFSDEKFELSLAFLSELEQGKIQCLSKKDGEWIVDTRVKKGILFSFKIAQAESVTLSPLFFRDKSNLFPREFSKNFDGRIVPGGVSIRKGAYIGNKCVFMPPSFVNTGAYVSDNVMVDSNALVGSCAYVGANVHLSAGAQLGGVLEPINSSPVIIEDDVLVGANSGVFEGTIVKKGAVIAAGVNLTKGMTIYDHVHEKILEHQNGSLVVPENAVVVMGARPLKSDFARKHQLNIATPVIVKYKDEKTSSKIALESALRS